VPDAADVDRPRRVFDEVDKAVRPVKDLTPIRPKLVKGASDFREAREDLCALYDGSSQDREGGFAQRRRVTVEAFQILFRPR